MLYCLITEKLYLLIFHGMKNTSLLYGFYTLKFVQTKKTRYNVITGELLTFHLHTEHS